VDEYLPQVYHYALRLTGSRQEAEELAQETFLRAWRRRRQLRDRRNTAVWLLTITRNLWNDRLRRKSRRPLVVEPLEDIYEARDSGPDDDLMVREDLRRVLEAMNSLPPRQREVLCLFACEGLALGGIAQVLGITTEAAKASLCEARKRLRRTFLSSDCAGCHNEKKTQ
jgi:RNA polymerase sigma-70 factor (ECF subfamily)